MPPDSLAERLSVIETKLDTVLEYQEKREVKQDEKTSDHEDRLRGLEQWKWKIVGMAIGLSTLVSIGTRFM